MAVRYNYPFNAAANVCNFDLLNPRSKTGSIYLYNNLNTVNSQPLQIDLRTRVLTGDGGLNFYKNNFAYTSGNPTGIADPNRNFNAIDKTYSFWIKPNNINDTQIIMSLGWAVLSFSVYISSGNIVACFCDTRSLGLEQINVTYQPVLCGIWQNVTVACSNFTNVPSPLIYVNGISALNYKTNRSGTPLSVAFPSTNAFGIRGVLHFGCNFYTQCSIVDIGYSPLILLQGVRTISPGVSGFMGTMGGNFYYFNKVLTRSEIIELINKDKRRYV